MRAGVFPHSSCAMLATDQREGYQRHCSPGLATTQRQEPLAGQHMYGGFVHLLRVLPAGGHCQLMESRDQTPFP